MLSKEPHLNVVVTAAAGDKNVELTERSDDELVLICRAGNDQAFDTLVRRYQTPLLRLAGKYLGDKTMAKDAVQRAFMELHRYLPRYQPQGRFNYFFYRVFFNQCRMVRRAARNHKGDTDEATALPYEGEQPDDVLLAEERRRLVDKALQKLRDKLRIVVVLRFSNELSLEEIGEILSLPVGTVKSRLFAGLQKLREHLRGAPL